ncbi:Hypothetical predicted protein [Mytilus galloprovincialis]|uniref:Uncharacterized protein n=1 Tax=Mytilus galloprovincialis TaxID=29158 RepID=A0A8B6FE43_MYTGA|nr:Hypothetical predicted protein [Mytilus galloprovincialis]
MKTGGMRPIIDLSILNNILIVSHFKMEINRSIRASILPGMWTTSLEFSYAYFHIPISRTYRKYLRFVWNNTVFQFKDLPFRLFTAPLAFTKSMQVALAHPHSLSIQIHSYLDDSLLKELCPIKLRVQTDLVINCFLSLGFLISWKKSEIIPSQDFVFLGEHFLTSVGLVLPPEEKFTKLCQKIHLFLTVQSVTARQFLQLLGLLNSLADVIPLGRLHIRPLQFYLHKLWIAASQEWEALIPITQPLFPHLQWWLVRENVMRGLCLSPQVPSLTLFTDASTLGWGAYLEGLTISGVWSPDLLEEHINVLEMKAVLFALNHFQMSLKNQSVILATDNTTVVAYLKNQGGTHSPSLYQIARDILLLCFQLQVHLVVRHIAGHLNILADTLSRSLAPVNTEWELLQVVFKAVTLHWGSPQIDLFATSLNHKLLTFVSPVPDPKSFAVDAMSLSWKGMFGYAFPPFRFLSPVLQKIAGENCKIIVIAPAWPKQSWFPDLLRLSCACPLVLPLRPDLLSQIKGKVLYQNPEKLHLHACLYRCQAVFLDSVELAPNIARNQALKENVFMMIVCIELRIPMFLVGKPGSSKSLAKTIVADAMQGNAAHNDLFKSYKQVQMVSYQCSPLSVPEGIVRTFRQCAAYQKDKNLDRFVSIVVLDEIGLAEDSPRMPLKTLHPLLEDGCPDDEEPEKYKKVGIYLFNYTKGICSTSKKVLKLIKPMIPLMADSYLDLFKEASTKMREFFGLRDFYSLLKMLYAFVSASRKKPTWPQLEHCILRNFGGLEDVKPVEIFYNSLSHLVDKTEQKREEDPDCTSSGMIQACLTGDKGDNRSNSPYVSIPGSDYLLDGSLPLSPPQTTSTLTGVSTTVSGNATYPTLSQGSAMHFWGVPTSTSVTHTLSRPVNSAGTISSVPGTAMGLNLPGSRPPLSYCGYMLPNTGTQPLPSWSQPPWPQSYPYGGFMPNQPGFWPYRDNFYGPPSGVATAPPLAPALPVAVSLTSAVAPSTTVPDSQASSSSHGTQVSDHASPLDGLQKLLLDFGESFKAEFSTLSSRMTLLENRVSSHQPSPAKSVECDEREDDELSVSPGSHERAFLTDEDVESSSSPKVSKTAPEPSSKSAQQPPTKETEDPPSLKDLRDKVYTLMRDEAHIPFASPSKPKKPSSTFEASCGISQDTVTSHNSFPESGHMAFALQFINEGIANSASEKVANNNISGFGMSSFSDQVKYKDFDIFDSSLGRLVPNCDKSMSSLLGKKPVDGLRLTQPVWSKTENLLRSASQVLGTAEHFLAATGHLLNSEDSVVPAEVRSFLLQLDKALGSSQLLLMGSIANCTLSKRAEFLENISIAEPLKDSLLKSPLSDKMFGLPLQRVQEELSKNPPPVKVSVQVTNGKRSVNATSSSTSTSASGGPPSSAKKRKNNYGKPQNKPNNSGKSSGKPSGGFKGSKKPGSST